MMKIAVVGVGGLGGYIGGRLAHSGHDVTFLARGQRLAALRQNGLQVRNPDGEFVIQPIQATDNPAEVGPVDLILFCVKTYDVVTAAESLLPLVGPGTALLPVQNGIAHLDQLRAILGKAVVLGGMAMINAHSPAPGVIERPGGPHHLEFGELDGEPLARCTAIAQAIKAAGIEAIVAPRIAERMWWKLVGVCAAGVLCLMRGSKGQVWDYPETRNLMHQTIGEGVAVAQAHGVALPPTLPDDLLKAFDSFPPPYKPSLLVDLEHGRRLEIEAWNGALVRYGKAAGVPTPVNGVIYACLKPYANGALA
ncbi:MAG: ketopantoate reductase family protein [Caldilinea sp. CFX5]|nr:ketopantoate reductase family protein [Caldilinea sp. CFX5]